MTSSRAPDEPPCRECGESPCPAHAASRRLAEMMACPRCGEIMEDPRVLHCLHTACLACLAAEHRGNSIRCPLCSFATPCPAAHALPRNTYIEAEYRRRQGVKGCRNCGAKEPTVYCAPCAALLCEACDTLIHANPIFKRHQRHPTAGEKVQAAIARVQQAAAADDDATEAALPSDQDAAIAAAAELGCLAVPVTCARHGSSMLTSFCGTCSVAVCAACVQESHRGHAVRPLAPTAQNIKAAAPQAVAGLASVVAHLSAGVRDVRSCQGAVAAASATCEEQVNATFDRLAAQLAARRIVVLAQLRDVTERKQELLGAQCASLEQMLDSIDRSQQLCAALVRNSGDFMLPELANIGAHVEGYCTFVRGQRLDTDPCVDADIRPRFGDDVVTPEAPASFRTAEEAELTRRIEAMGSIEARSVIERRFRFAATGDHQGVLYYLGTSRGIKLYENPCAIGRAHVAASSVGYGRPENVVGDGPSDFCTHNEPYAWVAIDLEAPLRVEHYSVRHDAYDKESHFLRHWELQGWRGAGAEAGGSGDAGVADGDKAGGTQWDTLALHQNDKALSERTPFADWPVSGCRAQGYRRFRLVLTGPNSHGNHYLMASGVELYGVLLG